VSTYYPQPDAPAGSLRPVDAFKSAMDLIKPNYLLLLGIVLVGSLIGLFSCAILFGPMMCGIFVCYLAAIRGEQVAFDRLFKGFDYFLPGFLVILVMIGLSLILNIPNWLVGAMSGAADNSSDVYGGAGLALSGLAIVVNLATAAVQSFVSTMLMFAFPLIVDRGLGAGDALGTSLRASLANIPGVLGLALINFGIGLVGVLLCCIGGIFLVPLQFAMYAVAYRQMFPDTTPAAPGGYPPAQGGWPPQSPGGGWPPPGQGGGWPPPGQGPYGGPGSGGGAPY
jgi:hypothetical protein